MKTLNQYLSDLGVDTDLASVILSLAEGCRKIGEAFSRVEGGKIGKAESTNSSGEEQLTLDISSDRLMQSEMERNEFVGLVASEEQDDEIVVGDGKYAVCYDPFDGSSLADSNLSVGSIMGVYEADTFFGVKGEQQLVSMIAVYGPRITLMLTVRSGVVEFLLRDGEFVLNGEGFSVGDGKMFAPGNLMACAKRPAYFDLVNFWIKNGYKLRYSGGMVPDVNQIFIKGNGIFAYPGFDGQPDGKLRLLFECAPIALLMEQAGGAASDGKVRILEKEIVELAQRTEIFVGGKTEVSRCEEFLFGTS